MIGSSMSGHPLERLLLGGRPPYQRPCSLIIDSHLTQVCYEVDSGNSSLFISKSATGRMWLFPRRLTFKQFLQFRIRIWVSLQLCQKPFILFVTKHNISQFVCMRQIRRQSLNKLFFTILLFSFFSFFLITQQYILDTSATWPLNAIISCLS